MARGGSVFAFSCPQPSWAWQVFSNAWPTRACGAWTEWMERFWERDANITLPRFKVAYSKSLNEALKALGMAVAFDVDRADFSIMCPIPPLPLVHIADVLHKTFMEVNEEGTRRLR